MALTVGHVIRRTWEGMQANPAPLFGVVAVFMLPGAVIAGVVGRLYNPTNVDAANMGSFFVATWGASIASMLFYAIAQSAALFVALDWLAGDTSSFSSASRRALSRIVGIIITSVLFYLAFGIGIVLCFIPGFIALAGFGLAIPALLAERLGPVQAMQRSWELTKGHRLLILTALLSVGFATMVVSVVVQFATVGNVFADPTAPYKVSLTAWTVQHGLNYLFGIVVTAVFAVLGAVLYSEVRNLKEGVDVESLATVFQ